MRGTGEAGVDASVLFLFTIGELYRLGVFGNSTYGQLADWLLEVFEIPYTRNTVVNKLKEDIPEGEVLAEALRAFKRSEAIRLKNNAKS